MNVGDFAKFFEALNGVPPFAWQRRLCEGLVETGRWPDAIVAPTGSGKSNVVDVHVFANALAAVGAGARVPRRLFVSVNRRALVDDHYQRAKEIADVLERPTHPILRQIQGALASLVQRPIYGPRTNVTPSLLVASLRGGVTPGREWVEDPRGCAIISATPDMWGSRLLFRGYGTTREARPREAGLIAYDSVLILDEAHLNRQLLHTARVVAEEVRRSSALAVPTLQVVSTSATQNAESPTVEGVEPGDLDGLADISLARRLTLPKPVTVHRTPAMASGKLTSAYVRYLCDVAQLAYEAQLGDCARTVGVVVNNVATAIAVAAELRGRCRKGSADHEVVAWVGRMRSMDIALMRAERPGLFTVDGAPEVAFLVATQTIEVGVDLDLAALVTELAPGTALAQRAGRVNRLGLREVGPIHVIAPESLSDRLPYLADDLAQGLSWLDRRSQSAEGLAPWALVEDPPPSESMRRLVLSTLRYADWQLLSETSVPLFSEPELAFWLRDELASEVQPVSIVVRASLPENDAAALQLLRNTGVQADEMFPSTIGDARKVIERVLSADVRSRGFLLQDDVWAPIDANTQLRPADCVVLDAGHAITTQRIIDPNASESELLPVRWTPPSSSSMETDDQACQGWVIVPADTSAEGERWLHLVENELPEHASEILSDELGYAVEVVLSDPACESEQEWVLVRALKVAVHDPEARQELSGGEVVSLQRHQAAVADLAGIMADALEMPDVVEPLRVSGMHHDDGKSHPEFQAILNRSDDDPILAKSGMRSVAQAQRIRSRSALPQGWRHEQLSAAMAYDLGLGDLVVRLVGTSHGRGRPFFPHGGGLELAGEIPRPGTSALFVDGPGWFDIIERTDAAFGVWGCAYLEAILRSADCIVSGEGS